MSCHCDCRPSCPYVEWLHPLCCNPAHFCCAGCENGPTLVIHKIVLAPCGGQSCTCLLYTSTMKKAAGILLLVLLVAAFALPGSADMNKYSTVFMDTFDTVISLIGYAENQETFDARAAETHAMYLHLHKLFDTCLLYTSPSARSVSAPMR